MAGVVLIIVCCQFSVLARVWEGVGRTDFTPSHPGYLTPTVLGIPRNSPVKCRLIMRVFEEFWLSADDFSNEAESGGMGGEVTYSGHGY